MSVTVTLQRGYRDTVQMFDRAFWNAVGTDHCSQLINIYGFRPAYYTYDYQLMVISTYYSKQSVLTLITLQTEAMAL